mmetsp:Transcript_11726/g.15913  ORF Transcript_11726/g.15913 Transcript_11726/m.15913 type:complete len:404 (-) Transcript_11726:331-1542(-)
MLGLAKGALTTVFPVLRPSYWPLPSQKDPRDPMWSGSDRPQVDKETGKALSDDVGTDGAGKRCLLKKRPDGEIKDSDFEFVQVPIPEKPEPGFVIVQNIYASIDPTHRIWMSDFPQYMKCVGLGTAMRASTVCRVIKSSDERKIKVGSMYTTFGGIQEYSIVPFEALNPLVPGVPLSYNLSLFSPIIGLTAWVGINILEIKSTDTVIISGAAGAVGSVAGQLAKLRGAKRVIGIAGTPEKCKFLLEECNLDATINYKTDDLATKIDELCPDGVDCYFDNVGGKTLEVILTKMNYFGRITFCGAISGYNAKDDAIPPLQNYMSVLTRRLKIQGLICADHLSDISSCFGELLAYHKRNKLVFKEHIVSKPVDEYPNVVRMLYSGANTGKLVMQLAPEDESKKTSL